MCIRDRGLALAEKTGADLMLATDPDADRVGIAVRAADSSYKPVSYTHLDVYKRQFLYRCNAGLLWL